MTAHTCLRIGAVFILLPLTVATSQIDGNDSTSPDLGTYMFPILLKPQEKISLPEVEVNLKVVTSVRTDRPHMAYELADVPLELLPSDTVEFTDWLIRRRFVNDKPFASDRYQGISTENAGETAVFRLLYTPLRLERGARTQELWMYYLSLLGKSGGKYESLELFLIDKNGNILLGQDRGPYSWRILDCRQEKEGLVVRTIFPYPGKRGISQVDGTLTEFLYREESPQLVRIYREPFKYATDDIVPD